MKLCHTSDLAEDSAQEFNLPDGRRIFVVRKDNLFYGYQNHCPHAGLPLNMTPTDFLDLDKRYIRCVNHMALFEIDSGNCIDGPCFGSQLKKETIVLKDDSLWIEL